MDKNRKVHQFKNPVLNWIEFRLPIISYFKKEYGDYPMPKNCLLYTSPSPRDLSSSRMPSSA